mmetsp:Transcript_14339/g.30897  ORF Transcript_14339/g.30897 Transcript_14339/m.30897 type:complete len:475 (+) Transcript_14339:180-1604(+)|eukprot:CAMPEP_0185847534 /NCGR_PEP_ID=MMETSP1354-20130828/2773_1 /TAXON_ID=708628 /ORGANISM="Erythrolobus madagascarensis, Strain CCMP3276" /LENGTH=474 /DNA_ID=CAMNT_0028547839 /DNA_START=174 /DNA_END=1598 /DNA_ORIENTATION=-
MTFVDGTERNETAGFGVRSGRGAWDELMEPSLVALYFACFMSCASFGIVLPSLAPYVFGLPSGSESLLAVIVSIYSVGEALGALALGFLSTTRAGMKLTLVVGVAFGLCGSWFYATASLFGASAARVVLLGRFLQGVWAGGAQSTQQAYVALKLANSANALNLANVLINAIAVLGFTIGPALGILFHPINFRFGSYTVDELNAPGHFVALCCALTILMFLAFFPANLHSSPPAPSEPSFKPSSFPDDLEAEQRIPLLSSTTARLGNEGAAAPYGKLILLNVVFGTQYISFALQEAITTPVVQQLYSWTVVQANVLFSAAALLALLVFVGVMVYQSTIAPVSQRGMVLLSLLLGIIGNALIVPYNSTAALPPARFLTGFFLASLVTPIGRPAVMSLYMQILGDLPQGTWMGILLATGAASRVLGPYVGVKGFFTLGVGVVFGATALVFVPVTLWFACCNMTRVHYSLDQIGLTSR